MKTLKLNSLNTSISIGPGEKAKIQLKSKSLKLYNKIKKNWRDTHNENDEFKISAKDKLPEDYKKSFLSALKSGNYKKITGQFCKVNKKTEEPYGYCVLGLASIVAGIPIDALKEVENPSDLPTKYRNLLPNVLVDGHISDTLMENNDGSKMSFSDMAEFVEEYL